MWVCAGVRDGGGGGGGAPPSGGGTLKQLHRASQAGRSTEQGCGSCTERQGLRGLPHPLLIIHGPLVPEEAAAGDELSIPSQAQQGARQQHVDQNGGAHLRGRGSSVCGYERAHGAVGQQARLAREEPGGRRTCMHVAPGPLPGAC